MGDHGSLTKGFNAHSMGMWAMNIAMIGMIFAMLTPHATLGNFVVEGLKMLGSGLLDFFQHLPVAVDMVQHAFNGNLMPVDGGAGMVASSTMSMGTTGGVAAAGSGMVHGAVPAALAAKAGAAVSLKGTWLASASPALQAKFSALSAADWADFRGLSAQVQHGLVDQLPVYEGAGMSLHDTIQSFCLQ